MSSPLCKFQRRPNRHQKRSSSTGKRWAKIGQKSGHTLGSLPIGCHRLRSKGAKSLERGKAEVPERANEESDFAFFPFALTEFSKPKGLSSEKFRRVRLLPDRKKSGKPVNLPQVCLHRLQKVALKFSLRHADNRFGCEVSLVSLSSFSDLSGTPLSVPNISCWRVFPSVEKRRLPKVIVQ